jgi:single-strand DNA-binding protein
MLNKAQLIGRLGKDPETRFTATGTPVATFSMATDETWKDKASGERKSKTEWHRIVLWGKLAEITQQYLKKGMLVYIEGKLQTRSWEGKEDGVKRYTTEINAFVMRMLEKKKDGAPHPAEAEEPQASGSNSTGQDFSGPEISDEDIPF